MNAYLVTLTACQGLIIVLLVASHIVLVRVVSKVHGPSRVMFQRGYELGLGKGYQDGRRAALPVVVSMTRTSPISPNHPAGRGRVTVDA